MDEIELAEWVEDVLNDTADPDVVSLMWTVEKMSAHEAALAQAELRRRTGRPYKVVAGRITTFVTTDP